MAEFRVTIQEEGQTFQVSAGEMLLDAALRQSVEIPYSCRSGTCRTCLLHVITGEVEAVDVDQCLISAEELAMNRRLACMSVVKSDAVVEVQRKKKRNA